MVIARPLEFVYTSSRSREIIAFFQNILNFWCAFFLYSQWVQTSLEKSSSLWWVFIVRWRSKILSTDYYGLNMKHVHKSSCVEGHLVGLERCANVEVSDLIDGLILCWRHNLIVGRWWQVGCTRSRCPEARPSKAVFCHHPLLLFLLPATKITSFSFSPISAKILYLVSETMEPPDHGL